jgi:hypothetical protein
VEDLSERKIVNDDKTFFRSFSELAQRRAFQNVGESQKTFNGANSSPKPFTPTLYSSRSSLRQPHVAQVLIDVVARADFPSLEAAAVRHDSLPPEHGELIGLLADGAFFHLPQER